MGSKTEEKYVCELCKLSFSSKQELNEHDWSLLHHRQLDKEKGRDAVHRCSLCKEDHFGLLSFTKHIQSDKHTNEAKKLKYSESKETSHLSTPIQVTPDSMSGSLQNQSAEGLALPAAHFLPRARYFQSLENPLASAPIDPMMRNAIRRPPPPRSQRFTPQHRPFMPAQRSNFRPRYPSPTHHFRYRGSSFSSSSYQNLSSNCIAISNNSFNNSKNNFNLTSPTSMTGDVSFSNNSTSAISDRDHKSHISSYPRIPVQLQSSSKVRHTNVNSNKISASAIGSISSSNSTTASVSSSHLGAANSVNEMINNVMSTTPIIPLTDEIPKSQLDQLNFSPPEEEDIFSSPHITSHTKKQKLEHSRKNESHEKFKKRGNVERKFSLGNSSINSTGDELSFSQSAAITKRLNKNKKNLPSRNKGNSFSNNQRARRSRNKNASTDNLNLNVQFVLKKGREIVKRYNKSMNKNTMNKKSHGKLDHRKIMRLRGIAGYDEPLDDTDNNLELVVPCISNVHSIAATKDHNKSSKENYTTIIGEQEALHDALLLQQVKPVRVELSSLSPSAYNVGARSPKKVQFVQGKTFDPTLLVSGRDLSNISSGEVSGPIISDNVTVAKTVLSFSLGSENFSLVPSPRASTPSLPKESRSELTSSDVSSTTKRKKKKHQLNKYVDSFEKTGNEPQPDHVIESTKQGHGEATNSFCPGAVESARSNTLLSTTLGDVEDIEKDTESTDDNVYVSRTTRHQEEAIIQIKGSINPDVISANSLSDLGITNEKRTVASSKVKQRFRRTSMNCNFTNMSAGTDQATTVVQNDVGVGQISLARSLSESDAIDTTDDVGSLCDVIIIDYDSDDELQSEESADLDNFVPQECKPEDCKNEEEKHTAEHHCEFKKKDGTYCHNITENRFCEYHRRVVKAVELFVSKKMAAGSSQADAVSLIDVDESEFDAVSSRRKSETQDDSNCVNASDQEPVISRLTRRKSQSACLPAEAETSTTAPQASTSVPKISKARKQARFKYLRSLTTNPGNEVHKSNLPPTVRKLLDKKSSGHAIGPNVPVITGQPESENDIRVEKPCKSAEKTMEKGLKDKLKQPVVSVTSDLHGEKNCEESPTINENVHAELGEEVNNYQSITREVMDDQVPAGETFTASSTVVVETTVSMSQMTSINTALEDRKESGVVGSAGVVDNFNSDVNETANDLDVPVSNDSSNPALANNSSEVGVDNQYVTEPPCNSLDNPISNEGNESIVHNPLPSNLVESHEKVDDSISFNIEPLPLTEQESLKAIDNEEALVTCDDVHFHSVCESMATDNRNNIQEAQQMADSTLETFKSFDYDESDSDDNGSEEDKVSEVSETIPVGGDSLLLRTVNETNINTDETLIVLENEMDQLIADEEESLNKLLHANTALEQLRTEMLRVQTEICLHASHMQSITSRKNELYQKLKECRTQKSDGNTRTENGTSLLECSSSALGNTSSFALCGAGYSSSDDSVPLSVLRKQRSCSASGKRVPTDSDKKIGNRDIDLSHSSSPSDVDEDFSCELGSVYDTPPGSLKSEKSGTKRPNSSNDESVREGVSSPNDGNSRSLRSRSKRNKNVK